MKQQIWVAQAASSAGPLVADALGGAWGHPPTTGIAPGPAIMPMAGAPSPARRRWLRRGGGVAAALAAAIVLVVAADRWLRITTFASTPPAPVPDGRLFTPPIVLSITVSAGNQRAPWSTTDQEVLGNAEMWKRMHLSDWSAVPARFRVRGLEDMLLRYRDILNNPSAWDAMSAHDWDAVPQPVRTVAYRRMVAYWAGFYDVGAEFDLPPALVSDTLAAIVMSESWFEHRARSLNRDLTWDVGLAQASPFARQRLRELSAAGLVDAHLSDGDYDNPWMATRFVALWMQLMLKESDGDLALAVRAYNRGTGDAADRLGAEYLAVVQRRLAQYIRNLDAPASWDFVWRHSRDLIRTGRATAR